MIPIADAHCDLPSKWVRQGKFSSLFDITPEKAGSGGLALQTVGCYVNARRVAQPRLQALAQLKAIHEMAETTDNWSLYQTGMLPETGKTYLLPALEGADCLEASTDRLEEFVSFGIRSVGLVWNYENALAGGATAKEIVGLKEAGARIVDWLQSHHTVVDCAHMNRLSFWDTEKRCETFMVSHTACDALVPHPRNLKDEQLACVKEHDGYLGIAFYPDFLTGTSRASVDDFVRHLTHAVEKAGIAHVGFGSDFDGIESKIAGVEDCSKTQLLAEALLSAGFTREETECLCWRNYFRFLEKVLR